METGRQPEDAAGSSSSARAARYCTERIAHWNGVAQGPQEGSAFSRAYAARLADLYQQVIQPGWRVLEIGCGRGDLLAALAPARGVGVDFAPGMVEAARARHPHLEFLTQDAHELRVEGEFDAIVLSDVVNDLWDVQTVLARVKEHCSARTRVVFNFYSRLWELPLGAARTLGLARPQLRQNWLTPEDVENLLELAGLQRIRRSQEILLPAPVPVLGPLLNRVAVRLWPFRHLALTNLVVARPQPVQRARPAPRVSVIVPARNEAGNIAAIVDRVPEMGAGTEIVFVEGHSRDDTVAAIERAIAGAPARRCKFLRQPGKGKGDAVRMGFDAAEGDVLMILDADLTVDPADLPRFYAALVEGKGEFVNGVRLVYPMEEKAMRFLNLLANKSFGLAFSWLLGQPIRDTLCGTKVLWRDDWRHIVAGRGHFGDFDPFGDFDLLFGAARLGLKIVDLPVRYGERTYGETNIQRFRHGLLLARMVLVAARRLKFT